MFIYAFSLHSRRAVKLFRLMNESEFARLISFKFKSSSAAAVTS